MIPILVAQIPASLVSTPAGDAAVSTSTAGKNSGIPQPLTSDPGKFADLLAKLYAGTSAVNASTAPNEAAIQSATATPAVPSGPKKSKEQVTQAAPGVKLDSMKTDVLANPAPSKSALPTTPVPMPIPSGEKKSKEQVPQSAAGAGSVPVSFTPTPVTANRSSATPSLGQTPATPAAAGAGSVPVSFTPTAVTANRSSATPRLGQPPATPAVVAATATTNEPVSTVPVGKALPAEVNKVTSDLDVSPMPTADNFQLPTVKGAPTVFGAIANQVPNSVEVIDNPATGIPATMSNPTPAATSVTATNVLTAVVAGEKDSPFDDTVAASTNHAPGGRQTAGETKNRPDADPAAPISDVLVRSPNSQAQTVANTATKPHSAAASSTETMPEIPIRTAATVVPGQAFPAARNGSALPATAEFVAPVQGTQTQAAVVAAVAAMPSEAAPAEQNPRNRSAAPATPVASAAAAAATVQPPGAANIGGAAPVQNAAAPAVAEQVLNQIGGSLNQLRQQGRVDVQINLSPPQLGQVQLHLSLQNNQVSVRMVVQDDSVKRLLDQQMTPLRDRIAQMGVSVGHFDVRRDGSSPNQEQPPAPNPTSNTAQAAAGGKISLRKTYVPLANPSALVDVIA
jgi:flagellar hook-length control protein FliK